MKHICKYCNKEFPTSQKLGGHVSRCPEKPNAKEIQEKCRNTRKKNSNVIERELICPICGNSYKVICSDKEILKEKYKKTCSPKCANKLSYLNSDNNTKYLKIKQTFKNKNIDYCHNRGKHLIDGHYIYDPNYKRIIYNNCIECGKSLEGLNRNKSKFCSDECRDIHRHRILSENAKKSNFGGYKPNSIKKHKHGNYLGLHYDSSWELAFIVYCKEHNMDIQKYQGYRTYVFENKEHKYFPDFTVDGKHYEIKGYYDEYAKAKHLQNPDIILLDSKKMKKYIDYTIQKYGNDYVNILNTK